LKSVFKRTLTVGFLLTTADYFSLGNRSDAYTIITWKIAKFYDYRRSIIHHLYTNKLFHWDINIRKLASKSLHGLVSEDIGYFCSSVLPNLMEMSLDIENMHVRHGAVLGVAEIVLAVAEIQQLSAISDTNLATLTSLVATIEKKRLYRGRGGEIMRSAVCRLVECISIAKVPLIVKDQVKLLDSVDSSIPHPFETIQSDACVALNQLMVSYFPVGEKGPTPRLQARVVEKFVKICETSDNPAVTRGYALALGYLPPKLVAPSSTVLSSILMCLIRSSRYDSLVGGEANAETRRNALLSLTRLVKQVGISPGMKSGYPLVYLSTEQTLQIFDAFLLALNDYKTDRRGDVGSWCRMTAMEALTYLLPLSVSSAELKAKLKEGLATKVVGGLLKQLAEKLDTVRQRAGYCLTSILQQKDPHIPGIAAHEALVSALEACQSGDSPTRQNWSDPQYTFPKLIRAASINDAGSIYFDNIISGIVLSIGGLTETVSKQASASLLQWAKEGDGSQREKLWNFLLGLLKRYRGSGRLMLPTLKTINMLLTHQLFDELIQSPGSNNMTCCQELLQEEEAGCNDVHRLFAIVDVSVSLLCASPTEVSAKQNALAFLCRTLAHKYPRVRSHTAQQFYLYLLESSEETEEHVLDIVLNTPWASEDVIDQKKKIRELADLLGVPDEFNQQTVNCLEDSK
jgi:hypothetical protein